MLFNVPQFIDVEDKVVGPLTAKQFGWLALGGVCVLVAHSFLDQSAFVIAVVIIGLMFGALAFYRPYNQPLIKFITSSAFFVYRPKLYIWQKEKEGGIQREKKVQVVAELPKRKTFDAKQTKSISQILDQKHQ
jgi:hypothetical protein